MPAKFGQMYGACVCALTITSTCGSSPVRDRRDLRPAEVRRTDRRRCTHPGFGAQATRPRRRRVLETALMERARRTRARPARCAASATSALTVGTSGRNSRPATPAGVTIVGVALERQADERDLRVVDLLDLVGRQDRRVGALVEHVRGEILEDRTRERLELAGVGAGTPTVLHAQELADPLVELVVPDTRHVEPSGVHRVDRRLVVEEPRDERRRADQVPGADGDRVAVQLAQTA